MSPERIIRATGLLACAAVAVLILIFAFTGAGQEKLQVIQTPQQYAEVLVAHPVALRVVLLTDNAFILFYVSMFLALGVVLWRLGSTPAVVGGAVALLCLTGALDIIENQHFLTMMLNAEQGRPPGSLEISLQVYESLVKFHVSFVGLFLLAAALPGRTTIERGYRWILFGVQLPASLLVSLTPLPIASPLVLLRSVCFVVGLVVIAWRFGARGAGAAGSGAPA